MDRDGQWQAWVLRSWHLAILRFAVTGEHSDSLSVLAIANEMDRLHKPRDEAVEFDFFRKTSRELCEAILHPNTDLSAAVLRQYLARVNDPRLKAALRAVISDEQAQQDRAKRTSKTYRDIWKGLPSRHNA